MICCGTLLRYKIKDPNVCRRCGSPHLAPFVSPVESRRPFSALEYVTGIVAGQSISVVKETTALARCGVRSEGSLRAVLIA